MLEYCGSGKSAPVEILEALPHSQAVIARHLCVICAYDAGYQLGLNRAFSSIPIFEKVCYHGKSAPAYILEELAPSQAGTGRHKCAICAFSAGLENGIKAEFEKILEKLSVPYDSFLQQMDVPARSPVTVPKEPEIHSAGRKTDYLKVNAERMRVGYVGELLVLKHEKEELTKKGLKKLASQVEHTSIERGDGLGYDIFSFTEKGEEKFIEVKTTRGGADTPFYMSANEMEFAKQNYGQYFLYRVFELNKTKNQGKFYVIQGEISDELKFTPIVFQVTR
jgi:hypothetical protein